MRCHAALSYIPFLFFFRKFSDEPNMAPLVRRAQYFKSVSPPVLGLVLIASQR